MKKMTKIERQSNNKSSLDSVELKRRYGGPKDQQIIRIADGILSRAVDLDRAANIARNVALLRRLEDDLSGREASTSDEAIVPKDVELQMSYGDRAGIGNRGRKITASLAEFSHPLETDSVDATYHVKQIDITRTPKDGNGLRIGATRGGMRAYYYRTPISGSTSINLIDGRLTASSQVVDPMAEDREGMPKIFSVQLSDEQAVSATARALANARDMTSRLRTEKSAHEKNPS